MVKRMIIMLLGLGVVLGALVGFKAFEDRLLKRTLDQYLAAPLTISATKAQAQTWGASLSAVGTLKAVYGVDVAAEVSGLVDSITFESGQRVKAGDLLIKLDDDVDQNNLKRYQAQIALAQATNRRNEELLERKLASQSAADQSIAALREAKAWAASTEGLIEQKEIRAPFSGRLGIRQVDLGQYLSPGAVIVNLQTEAPVLVDFSLPERDLPKVAPGQPIDVSVDAYPGERFTGRVTAMAARIDPQTRTLSVQGTLPNDDRRLYAGMFANVVLELPGQAHVIAVPQTAIAPALYGDSVFVVQPQQSQSQPQSQPQSQSERTPGQPDRRPAGGKPAADPGPVFIVKRRYVKVGEQRGGQVAVTSGLEAGERVVTSGQLKLKDGARVRIDNRVSLDGAPGAGG